jgi:hypothetical protein
MLLEQDPPRQTLPHASSQEQTTHETRHQMNQTTHKTNRDTKSTNSQISRPNTKRPSSQENEAERKGNRKSQRKYHGC